MTKEGINYIIVDKESDNMDGHRKRIKEKYLKNGIDGFLEYEILELLLTYSIPRRDVKATAKELLTKFGSLYEVFRADRKNLCEVEGIKENSYILFNLFRDIHRYIYRENRLLGKKISGTEELLEYLKMDLCHLKVEVFKVIFLDCHNVLIDEKTLFTGTLDKSYIYPRELVKEIFIRDAKSVIFVHNHPSGSITPSKADISFTNNMRFLLKELEINLLDHIIIGGDSYYSFLEENLI